MRSRILLLIRDKRSMVKGYKLFYMFLFSIAIPIFTLFSEQITEIFLYLYAFIFMYNTYVHECIIYCT